MSYNELENLKLNLTGNRRQDRQKVFLYIISQKSISNITSDIIVLAATFLPNSLQDFEEELAKDEMLYVHVLLRIATEERVEPLRRAEILSFLERYATKKDPRDLDGPYRSFNFVDDFEYGLYQKLTSGRNQDTEVLFPFFSIYLEYGLILEKIGDWNTAFVMFSKANQWNPLSTIVIGKLCKYLKNAKNHTDLLRLSTWFITVTYDLNEIAYAMRFSGYALYLDGRYEEAYAFYFQSLKYGEPQYSRLLNEEITSVLNAAGHKTPYNLTKKQISSLFLGKNYQPFPNEQVFDVLRDLIINKYINKDYVTVLDYGRHYIKNRPSDQKISNIFENSKNALN